MLDACLTNSIALKSVSLCVDFLDIVHVTVMDNEYGDCALIFVFFFNFLSINAPNVDHVS